MYSQSSYSPVADVDPLARVIGLLRPQTVLSKIVSGAGKWSVRYAAYEHPAFCLMLGGSCFLAVDGIGRMKLDAGDFLLLPAVPGFTMSSDPKLKPRLLAPALPPELRHGDEVGPPSMRQLGGYFLFDRTNAQLLTKLLPSHVLIRRGDEGASRVHRLISLIAEESNEHRPGRDLILARLVEVLMVEALRFRPPATNKEESGLLAGLADPAIARALRHVHDDVAHRWTVAELARVAGMSRAVFAERFMRKVGMPPMEYVTEWRIAIAKDVLRRDRAPLAQIAEQIGYQSASAFSTAFSRREGCAPSAFARASERMVDAGASPG